MKFIKILIEDKIGTLIFNNDDKKNCLNKVMISEIISSFDEFENHQVRVIVVRSNAGMNVWSAGLDINELPHPGNDPISYNHPLEKLFRKVQKCPIPVIAMIEGSVWGGACDLSFVCDILIGTPKTSFAITPAKLGVPYNASGMIHFLSMVEINVAKEMFFTARPISAEQARNIGILNHLVSIDELEQTAYELAKRITQNSPLSIAVMKEQLNILGAARPINSEFYEKIEELRHKAYDSEDYREGIRAFKEKRKPDFKGK